MGRGNDLSSTLGQTLLCIDQVRARMACLQFEANRPRIIANPFNLSGQYQQKIRRCIYLILLARPGHGARMIPKPLSLIAGTARKLLQFYDSSGHGQHS